MSEFKTNVMRMLDKAKVKYNHYSYADTDAVSGTEVAAVLHQNPERVFKTLVTLAKSGNHYVFMIPVEKELDLTFTINGLCSRRLFSYRDEEIFHNRN